MGIPAPAPCGRPRAARTRRYLAALGLSVVSIVASAVLAGPAAHASTSTVGGPISRSEVLARAAYWFNLSPHLTYNQNASAPDPQGRNYRTDCSGLVDMAWHLASGPNTDGLATSAYTTKIAGSALQPGDLLDDVVGPSTDHHAILFDAWESDHVHFSYYSFGATPMEHVFHATLTNGSGAGQLAGHPASDYAYYRYNNILNGGQLDREPSGAIAVIVGGAPARFQSMAELTAAGYANVPYTNVPAGYLASLPQVPSDGSIIRDNVTGEIDIIAGGARYWLSASQWAALGSPSYVNVPESFFPTLGTSPGIPSNGTYLMDNTTGAIYLVAGAAVYHLSFADYTQLGSPPFTDVPIGWIATLGTVPENGTIIRDVGTGAIYQMYQGKVYLSAADYAALGSPAYTNLPSSWIAAIPDSAH
jgi:hypothetical protein